MTDMWPEDSYDESEAYDDGEGVFDDAEAEDGEAEPMAENDDGEPAGRCGALAACNGCSARRPRDRGPCRRRAAVGGPARPTRNRR